MQDAAGNSGIWADDHPEFCAACRAACGSAELRIAFSRAVDGGFARAMWCGDRACEDKIKELTAASSRNMPFDQTPIGDTCVCCGKKADKLIYFARAY